MLSRKDEERCSGTAAAAAAAAAANGAADAVDPRRHEPSAMAKLAPSVERTYWDIVERGTQELWVEYGNDQDIRVVGSGFPRMSDAHKLRPRSAVWPKSTGGPDDDSELAGTQASASATRWQDHLAARVPPRFDDPEYYRACGWNLTNLPYVPDSLLRFLDGDVRAALHRIAPRRAALKY
ncbi:hypothetical protein EON66_07850 [archaeon]|nr:MAG: hypothetical protein EON66_07850 [archaeon]